jgi:hypothetical protein
MDRHHYHHSLTAMPHKAAKLAEGVYFGSSFFSVG